MRLPQRHDFCSTGSLTGVTMTRVACAVHAPGDTLETLLLAVAWCADPAGAIDQDLCHLKGGGCVAGVSGRSVW